MTVPSIHQSIYFNPPKWSPKVLLVEPYKIAAEYFQAASHLQSTQHVKPSLKDRAIFVVTGVSLLLPVINTIVYVVMRLFLQTLDAKNKSILLMNTLFKETIEQTHQIQDEVVRNSIKAFINQMGTDAREILQAQHYPEERLLILENIKLELSNIQTEIILLIALSPTELQSLRLTHEELSREVRRWQSKIMTLSRLLRKEQALIVFQEGLECGYLDKSEIYGGHFFHQVGKLSFLRFLLPQIENSGIDLTVQDNWGNTGLHWAIANANNGGAMQILHIERARSLLDLQCRRGNTPLHIAVAKGYKDRSKDGQKLDCSNLELVQKMVDYGANPNLQCQTGDTPLHYAYIRGDINMIEALLKYDADKNIPNKEGKTPVDLIGINYAQANQYLTKAVAVYLLDEDEFRAGHERLRKEGGFH